MVVPAGNEFQAIAVPIGRATEVIAVASNAKSSITLTFLPIVTDVSKPHQ
jgi:hypothetical protein